jgi:hypothetical protein
MMSRGDESTSLKDVMAVLVSTKAISSMHPSSASSLQFVFVISNTARE